MKTYDYIRSFLLPSSFPTAMIRCARQTLAAIAAVSLPEPARCAVSNVNPCAPTGNDLRDHFLRPVNMKTPTRIAWLTLLAILGFALSPSHVFASGLPESSPQSNSQVTALSQTESGASQENAIRGSFGLTLVKGIDSKKLK